MINRRRTFEYANTHGYLIKQADTNYQPTRLLKLSYVKFIFINVTWYQMFSQTIFFFFLRFLTFAFSTEENLRRRRKEKKKQKNWNERTRTQTKLSSRWKIFGSIVAQTVKFLCNRTAIRTRVVDTCVVWIQGGAPVVYRYIGAVCISDYSLCQWTCHVRAA